MYVIFNANNEKKEVTLPEGNWNACINDTLAGTDTIETISGTAEVAPVSALILVKGDGHDTSNGIAEFDHDRNVFHNFLRYG